MILTLTESSILLKIYDICYLSLDDIISTRLLYNLTSRRYLWKTLKELESKQVLTRTREGRINMIQLTSKGKILVKALNTIRNQ